MYVPSKSYLDEKGNVTRVYFRGHLTEAEVIAFDGTRAKAYARLNDGDTYSKEFGEILAVTRATYRVLRKLEKKLAVKGYKWTF